MELDDRKCHDVDNYHTNSNYLYEDDEHLNEDDDILHHDFDTHPFIPAIRLQVGSLKLGTRMVSREEGMVLRARRLLHNDYNSRPNHNKHRNGNHLDNHHCNYNYDNKLDYDSNNFDHIHDQIVNIRDIYQHLYFHQYYNHPCDCHCCDCH
jgi:hypothetical protein